MSLHFETDERRHVQLFIIHTHAQMSIAVCGGGGGGGGCSGTDHRQCQVWWQCGGKHLEQVGWGTRLGGSGLGIGDGNFSSSGSVQDRFFTFPSKLCHRLSTPKDPEQFKE